MSKNRAGPKCQALIVEDLLGGEADLAALSRRHFSGRGGAPLEKLAKWYKGKGASALMAGLRRLLEDRADLLTAQARAMAARRMFLMARDDGSKTPDVVRRACIDLLKLGGASRQAGLREAPREAEGESRAEEDRWRAVMNAVPMAGLEDEGEA
ncbi:MAG: hypothetical protein JNK58_09045 [Phycisphaerae bacterium]|nr:hypothetical protein [Phycisphaerae bacterium]